MSKCSANGIQIITDPVISRANLINKTKILDFEDDFFEVVLELMADIQGD